MTGALLTAQKVILTGCSAQIQSALVRSRANARSTVENEPDSYSPARTSIGRRRSSEKASQLSASSRSRESVMRSVRREKEMDVEEFPAAWKGREEESCTFPEVRFCA